MKAVVFIAVASIIVNTVMTVEQKHVNIALEAVMNFSGKRDKSSGLEVIDKVENALEKIKQGIESRKRYEPGNGRRSARDPDITFTDFVSEAAKILKNYNDNDLEDVFAVIGDETRRYINRNSELHELFGSGNMRRHLSEKLEDFRDMQADMLRDYLSAAIIAVENKKYNGEKNDLLDIGDFVYIGGHDKLRAVLRDLEKIGRSTDVRLDDVLRHTLRSFIFDHFNKLNDNIKHELIDMAKDYWRVSSSKRWKRRKRPTTFTSLEEDESTSKNYRHVYRKGLSFNVQTRQESSDIRPIQRTKKTHNASHHVNKRFNYKNRVQKDREVVTGSTKLYKYPNHTRSTLSDEDTTPPFEPESENKTEVENNKGKKSSKTSRRYKKKNKFTPSMAQTKRPKHSKDGEKPIDSPYSDLMLLTGGRNVQSVDLRGQSTEETYENYREPDKTKEEKQLSIVFSHHPTTAKYLSVERFLTIKKKNVPKAKEEKDDRRVVCVTVANISAEGLISLSAESSGNDYDLYKLENDRNLTNDRKLGKDYKIKNNHEPTNDHVFKNDGILEDKVINIYIKNDTIKIENSKVKNDSELENKSKLINDRELENKVIRKYTKNNTLEIEDSDTENDSGLEIDRKLENRRVIKKYIKNDTLEIENSEAENDSGLEIDHKLEDKVIRKYIKNDPLNIENSEAENYSTNDSELKNDRKLENKATRKYIKNDTLEIENSEAPIDVKNMFKNIKKQMAEVKEQVPEGFKNDRELDSKVTRKNNKNDTLRIDNPEASIYLKSMINNIQKQIDDVKKHIHEGIGNIREFVNDSKLENKVIRKYIKNDTFKFNNSEAPTDVEYMMDNIEKQIDGVNEQVDYVKNLRNIDDKLSKQNLRANSEKVYLRSSNSKHKHHYADSESLERDNKEYFTRVLSSESSSSIEITNKSSLAFRANYDTNYADVTETKINDNKRTKSVIVDKPSNTSAIGHRISKINFLSSKIKENVTVKDSFEEANKSISYDESKTAFDKNKTQEIKINDGDTKPFINMTINEIDTTTENITTS
ncbi:reticulocyte-binding protein homolog 1-like isoform X2 [Cydia splendana]|uniref:reticulocyte-binding protein homolog 1-like isoform X2 n=1 Tax=Cydia splendana TaxID=1100963 RepID=UPI00300C2324